MPGHTERQVFKVITATELSGKHIGKRISIEADGYRFGGVVSRIEHYEKGEVEVTFYQPVEIPAISSQPDSGSTQTLTTRLVGGDTRVVTPHDN